MCIFGAYARNIINSIIPCTEIISLRMSAEHDFIIIKETEILKNIKHHKSTEIWFKMDKYMNRSIRDGSWKSCLHITVIRTASLMRRHIFFRSISFILDGVCWAIRRRTPCGALIWRSSQSPQPLWFNVFVHDLWNGFFYHSFWYFFYFELCFDGLIFKKDFSISR